MTAIPRNASSRPSKRAPEVDTTDHSVHALTPYRIISVVLLIVLTILFIFPLYWIITGSYKKSIVLGCLLKILFILLHQSRIERFPL